jgi:glycerol-3-phosphate dehydrogenase
VLRYARKSPWGDERVTPEAPVLCAEVAYAREHAMAVTVDDVIYRRTALGGVGLVAPNVRERVAAIIN